MSARSLQPSVALLLALVATDLVAARRQAARGAPRRLEMRLDPGSVNDPNETPEIGPGSSGSAVLRAQILLARAHFSCAEIDARFGRVMRGAVAAFQKARGLESTGVVRAETWRFLNEDSAPALLSATIAPEDVAGPFTPIPDDTLEKAKLSELNYSSPLEGLSEKYHASPKLLTKLNPNVSFDKAGAEILVPNVSAPVPGRAAEVVVSKSKRCVIALDKDGRMLSYYPASVGSPHDPLPIGRWKIRGVARNPIFHYNPDLFWDAPVDEKAILPPGPNNPVGVCWIDITKPHYGIHGTPEPSQIGTTQSHGCIRLTNWDVQELSQMVRPGTPAILEE